MKLSRYAFAAALCAAAMGFTAAKAESVVHVVIEPEPPLLMQGLAQNAPTNTIAGNIYEGLLRYNQKLEPQPSLAKSWEISDDGLTYVFHLQEGVKWHDGQPFTADDVVFSLDVFLREVHPRWRPITDNQIASVEAVDPLTVRIVLKQPFGPLMTALEVASAPMIPKHIYEGTDFRTNPANNTPIGTGPYKLQEWKKGSYIHLVRNTDYWLAGHPKIDEIYWQVIPDAAARAVAFETGTIDVLPAGSVDVYDVARLSALEGACMTTGGWEMASPIAWIAVNLREGPLSDKTFRQGLMHAIDRNFGQEVVWNGLGRVPTGPIASTTRFYDPAVNIYDFDPDKARELIAQSGYKGETIRLLKLPYGEIWDRWAEAVRQNLLDVGVNVELVSSDTAGWTQKTSDWDFDMTFNFLYQLGDPAIGVSRSYVSSNIAKGNPFGNVGGYSNPAVDALFAAASAEADEAVRQAKYSEVQKILTDELPVLWLLEMEQPTIYRCDIKDLVTTAIGVNDGFRDAWRE
ncbi:ABC transporter substrate-binding protein [Xinfangfangia sp. D13-10-4-6]|uniref:ABC transporter substrate-binding protein n=1 Tax=Pseudogemmobacter hezensis TaxID=2737662 RepID=UPI00155234AA|nr:ABC transporter substrate-binding protein [Pseudogemmobacter hezensis]NPD16765.1 ABC transporter substrate-binding protein [Pseudogemmobacter hezensis]